MKRLIITLLATSFLTAPGAFAAPQDRQHVAAEAFDRGLAAPVERIGADLDALAAEHIERMCEQQALRLGVERGALHGRRIPGVADHQARYGGVERVEARRSDDAALAARQTLFALINGLREPAISGVVVRGRRVR